MVPPLGVGNDADTRKEQKREERESLTLCVESETIIFMGQGDTRGERETCKLFSFLFLLSELNLCGEERLIFAVGSLERGILLSCFLADSNVLEGETLETLHAFFCLVIESGQAFQHGFQWCFILCNRHLASGAGEESEDVGLRGEGRGILFHASIVARPFSRASDKSIFCFIFLAIETSRNKAPPPIS